MSNLSPEFKALNDIMSGPKRRKQELKHERWEQERAAREAMLTPDDRLREELSIEDQMKLWDDDDILPKATRKDPIWMVRQKAKSRGRTL